MGLSHVSPDIPLALCQATFYESSSKTDNLVEHAVNLPTECKPHDP
jgi:hypothetical protein